MPPAVLPSVTHQGMGFLRKMGKGSRKDNQIRVDFAQHEVELYNLQNLVETVFGLHTGLPLTGAFAYLLWSDFSAVGSGHRTQVRGCYGEYVNKYHLDEAVLEMHGVSEDQIKKTESLFGLPSGSLKDLLMEKAIDAHRLGLMNTQSDSCTPAELFAEKQNILRHTFPSIMVGGKRSTKSKSLPVSIPEETELTETSSELEIERITRGTPRDFTTLMQQIDQADDNVVYDLSSWAVRVWDSKQPVPLGGTDTLLYILSLSQYLEFLGLFFFHRTDGCSFFF